MIKNFMRSVVRIFAVLITVFLALSLPGERLVSAYGNCLDEMEKWSSTFQELKSAVERGESLKNVSVADEIRERLETLGPNETVAEAVRQVISQKKSAWESTQSACLELVDQERTAYKSLSRCVSSGLAKKDASLGADFRALSKERDLLLGTFKKAFSDPAFVQYQNQNPPSPGDHENPQYSYDRSYNRGYWGNYAPGSSTFSGR